MKSYLPYLEDRLTKLKELRNSAVRKPEELLSQLGIKLIIGDAREAHYAEGSLDLIHSNNTFEHIPKDILFQILKQFNKGLSVTSGVMSHFIDMSDHFAHFDGSITEYNFLQFSKAQWGRIDNTIQPQNRMRLKDYLHMYSELGITVRECTRKRSNIPDLKMSSIHDEYSDYSEEELSITHATIVSMK